MDRPIAEELRRRLERLERQNRQLKLAGVIVLLVFAATLVMGQAKPSSRLIETEKIVLKDDRGRTRVILGVMHPTASLAFLSPNKPQYGLFIYGADGKERARLAEFGDHGSQLVLLSEPMKAVASLRATVAAEPASSAELSLNSSEESLEWSEQKIRDWTNRIKPQVEETLRQTFRGDFKKAAEAASALGLPTTGHEISLGTTAGVVSGISIGPAPTTAGKGTVKLSSVGLAGASGTEVSIQGNDGKTRWRVP